MRENAVRRVLWQRATSALVCSAVRRADGETRQFGAPSPPMGTASDQEYEEGQVRLGPGDTLIVYTNGLVEVAGGTVELEDLLEGLKGAATAEEVVARLEGAVRGRQIDDAAVVVLRRAPGRGPASPGLGTA